MRTQLAAQHSHQLYASFEYLEPRLLLSVPEQFTIWGDLAATSSYLGDPGLSTPGTSTITPTSAETARGFAFFSKPSSYTLNPDYLPTSADRPASPTLSVSDAPGQYGPISLYTFALSTGSYSITVSNLTDGAGHTLNSENFDVRTVRYVKANGSGTAFPLLLESLASKTVYQNRLQQFWITYYIPPTATPGTYTGQVNIAVGGTNKLSVPLTMTVYPFVPVKPAEDIFMCYSSPTNTTNLYNDLMDQKLHGMTMSMISPVMDYNLDDLILSQTTPELDVYKNVFPNSKVFMGVYNQIISEWLNTPDTTTTPPMYGPWFRYYPFSSAIDAKYLAAINNLNNASKTRGLTMMLEVADEAGSHPWTQTAAQHYMALVRDNIPDVIRFQTVGGGWAMGYAEDQLWRGLAQIWSTNRWLVDKLNIVKSQNPTATIEVYNMANQGSTSGGTQSARDVFGFYSWAGDASVGGQYDYDPGSGQPDWRYGWPASVSSQGKLPTVRWEAVREGTKDLAYVETLERALKGRTDTLAQQAQAYLNSIKSQIVLPNPGSYDPIDGGRVDAMPVGTYETWRDTIASYIVQLGATVEGRSIFYNNSSFDGNNTAANAGDDAAIATDKTALLPGRTAVFANYTSFSRGINGIMIDVSGLAFPANLTLANVANYFSFKVGNSSTVSSWTTAPTPTAVTLRAGAGVNGTDRITITWADNAIQKQWLQVTALANTNTGLASADVFYFGNAIGDTGNSATDTAVNVSDMLGVRSNFRTLANPAPVTFAYDFNRDQQVNTNDMLISRDNTTTLANMLQLFTAPATSGPGVLKAESLVSGPAAALQPNSAQTLVNFVNSTRSRSSILPGLLVRKPPTINSNIATARTSLTQPFNAMSRPFVGPLLNLELEPVPYSWLSYNPLTTSLLAGTL